MITDYKIKNGDIVLDNAGRPIKLEGTDVLFQRALICIKAKLGGFIYNRGLGSQIKEVDLSADNAIQRLELIVNEALVRFENTCAELIRCSDGLMLINLTINGESRITEVQL